jgi:hypothetical protein
MKVISQTQTVAVVTGLLAICLACSTVQKKSASQKSAERLISFVETGDSTMLDGIFTDSVLNLMSIEAMLDTRNDFVQSFGKLQTVEGPEFSTDSTADIILRYEDMSLVSSLEFNSEGKIRFLSIRPEPVKSDETTVLETNLTEISEFADFGRDFNADTGFVRLVSILSPTCPMCRNQGYSAVQSIMREVPSGTFKSYIIWLPALPSDTRQDAAVAATEFSDERIKSYWDGDMKAANAFGKSLKISSFAWDVYLLYDRGVKIKKDNPADPKFWMHQLSLVGDRAPMLDSVVLRWKVEELIPSRSPQ